MIKKSNETTLGQAIQQFVDSYRMDDKLREVSIINSWESVVGKMIASHTTKMYVKNRKLHIKMDSSVIVNELKYARKKIMTALNKKAGQIIIEDIVFL